MVPTYDEIGGGKSYQPLMDALHADNIRASDLADALTGEDLTCEQHFMPGSHYSAHSNELVARLLAAEFPGL